MTRFVEGEIPPLERMREPETLLRVARALRAVHSGRRSGRFNSFRVVEDYRTTAFDRGAEVPPTYAWARQVGAADRAARRAARAAVPQRPPQRELHRRRRRIRIVDWEYAGMGDVFFDLANFAINHELDADGRERCSRPTSARSGPTSAARSS